MQILKDIWSNEKVQAGVFGVIFIIFAVDGLVTGEMCSLDKMCTSLITFDSSPMQWIIIQSISWGLGIFLLSRLFKK